MLEHRDATAMLGTQGHPTPLVNLLERAGANPTPPHARLGPPHFSIPLPARAPLVPLLGPPRPLRPRVGRGVVRLTRREPW